MKWPGGLRCVGLSAGIKSGGALDVGVIVADEPIAWAGTFTKNAAAAAPVVWCKALLGKPIRALVVNSGNANACTGKRGDEAVKQVTTATAQSVGCDRDEVLMASTGPIGIQLPADLIAGCLSGLPGKLVDDVDPFASAILTTDTRTKIASARAGDADVIGVAKGAAMLAPNMATMLAFIATDAAMGHHALQDSLAQCVDRSFNCLSIDACESTNDSVFALATGAGSRPDEALFEKALQAVCTDLAEQIARDAEGGTKVVRVRVSGALDDQSARGLGLAVASSALWRAAVNGADPNWGRILAAMGSVDRSLELESMNLAVGAVTLFDKGEPSGLLAEAGREMQADEFVVSCSVGRGPGRAEVITTDLSTDYVTLNATGTS